MEEPVNGTKRRLSELLSGDHREIDEQFEEFTATLASETAQRRERFERFAGDLRRHIEVEEARLFPVFGEGDPSRRALVDRMLEEHRRIEAILEEIRLRLDQGGGATTEDLEVELVNVLWEHNAREEGSVYPWFDTHLSSERTREVTQELGTPARSQSAP